MIAITRNGARLVDGRDDWLFLAALAVGIANAEAHKRGHAAEFDVHNSASALTYLTELDPPAGDDDVVLWTWTDDPTSSTHVARPAAETPVKARKTGVKVAA